MRNLTPREKAQAVIAQVRAEYPRPIAKPERGFHRGEYCVGIACTKWALGNASILFRVWYPITRSEVARLNDAGRFEEAWARAEDILCEHFTENI